MMKVKTKASGLSKEDLEVIKQIVKDMQVEKNKKADVFSVKVESTNSFKQSEEKDEECLWEHQDPASGLSQNQGSTATYEREDLKHVSVESAPLSTVLSVQHDSQDESAIGDEPLIQGEPPFQQFLCDLKEKGVARKFYLPLLKTFSPTKRFLTQRPTSP